MVEQELLLPDTEKYPELKVFRAQDAAIAELESRYGKLVIEDPNDQKTLSLVHSARMDVKKLRVTVEKERKRLKADSLAYGRAVDAEAKRIREPLEALEEHLQAQEDVVAAEQERIAELEQKKRQEAIDARIKLLAAVGVHLNSTVVESWSDETFSEKLHQSKLEFERVAAEKAAEEKRLADQKVEQDRIAAEQRAEQEKLAAERKVIEDEKKRLAEIEAEQQRQIDLEKAREEAVEKAKKDAERERIAAENEAKAEAAAKPYRTKLNALAKQVLSLDNPGGKHHEAVAEILVDASNAIKALAKKR